MTPLLSPSQVCAQLGGISKGSSLADKSPDFVPRAENDWIVALVHCLDTYLQSFPGPFLSQFVYGCVHVCIQVHMCADQCGRCMCSCLWETEDNLRCQAQQCTPPPLKQGLKLTQSSPIKLHLTDPLASASSVLALQRYTTVSSISHRFQGQNLDHDANIGKTFI